MSINALPMESSNNLDSTNNYLKTNELIEGSTYTKIAYITYSRGKVSNPMPDGYFTLRLKDYYGQSVMGVILNADSYNQAGLDLKQLTGKPVWITFTVEIFKNKYSLLISEVKAYTGSDFPYAAFVGEVKEAPQFLTALNQTMAGISETLRFDISLTTLAFDEILGGAVGGFCQVAYSTVQGLSGNIGLPNYQHSTALYIFCLAVENYVAYRMIKESNVGKLPSIETAITFIANATASIKVENIPHVKEYFADTLSVLLHVKDTPSTPYGYYIWTAYNNALNSASFAEQLQSLAAGFSLYIDGAEIYKYE